MSTQAPVETEVVSGQVVGVITKPGDKWQVEVNTGGQYTRRLWTKDAGLVNQMQGAVGQSFDFICGVSHWQGQSGPVRSLWINSVALFGSTPVLPTQQVPGTGAVQPVQGQVNTQGQPIPQQQQMLGNPPFPTGMPTLSPMEKDMRIMREHAMNMAVLMINQMKPEERTLQGLVGVAEGLIRYYQGGPEAVGAGNGQQPQQPQAQPDEYGAPPHTDDDIPF